MMQMALAGGGLRNGVWEAAITTAPDADAPQLEVRHMDRRIEGVTLAAVAGVPGTWGLRVPVPADCLNDGVQTFVIRDATTDATLGRFVIAAGETLGEDLLAEVSLLRAELDMLKRAFRRHCIETAAL